jgi:hypothetical protein
MSPVVRFGKSALIGLALLSLAGPAAAQSAQAAAPPARSLEAVYAVSGSVGAIGEFTYSFTQTGETYQAAARRRTTGMVRMLAGDSQDYDYSSRGAVAGAGQLRPAYYRHQGGRRDRIVEAAFSPDDIVTTTNPPGMGMGHPAATQAQKRGAIDQLSAIASMITASSDPCGRSLAVYMDGRSRFDFVMSPNGRVQVNTRAYRGEAIRCRVQFRPLAGFSDPQEPAELTFLFAPTSAGMFAPIRIQMPTNDVGVVTLEAREIKLNGAPLR